MDSVKAKLDKYEYIIQEQMAEIDRLRAENQRLIDWIMGDADAHTILQSVYLDPAASQGNRIKAAAASLPFERPKLTSVEPPLKLTAVVVPLKELLEMRRERSNRMRAIDGQILLPQPGNGSGMLISAKRTNLNQFVGHCDAFQSSAKHRLCSAATLRICWLNCRSVSA